MGDDTKIVKRKRIKKKFVSLAHRLDYLYGKEAKTYTLKGDPNHKDGMNFENRKCTDKICMILFWLMLVGKFYFFYYGFSKGNLARVLNGIDGAGNQCGMGAYEKYPYVYFSNITTNDIRGNSSQEIED